jgi:hypothetical protein
MTTVDDFCSVPRRPLCPTCGRAFDTPRSLRQHQGHMHPDVDVTECFCSRCQKTKPRSEFYERSPRRRYPMAWCKACTIASVQASQQRARKKKKRKAKPVPAPVPIIPEPAIVYRF